MLTVLGQFFNHLFSGVFFYFISGPVVLGVILLYRNWGCRGFRFIGWMLLFFVGWRACFFIQLPGSLSDRYSLAVLIPGLLFFGTGVRELNRICACEIKKFCRLQWKDWIFYLLIGGIIVVGQSIKCLRLPVHKEYLAQVSALLKKYPSGQYLDAMGVESRLSQHYHVAMRAIPVGYPADNRNKAQWQQAIEDNITLAEHTFLLTNWTPNEIPVIMQERFNASPARLCAEYAFRKQKITLWEIMPPLSADWRAPVRSFQTPNPLKFTLPKKILTPLNQMVAIKWAERIAPQNWQDYSYVIHCSHGRYYQDGFYYCRQPGDPDEIPLAIEIRDYYGVLLGKAETVLSLDARSVDLTAWPQPAHFPLKQKKNWRLAGTSVGCT